MKFTTVRGTRDLIDNTLQNMRSIEETTRRIATLFGYREIRTPTFEETDLFVRSIGTSTDIVEKEMYTFPDKKGRSLTLRPEGTAPVVRAYLQEHMHKKEKISRLFYTGPMFRYERPQAGRFREFWQVGAELFGIATPYADAEIIMINMMILEQSGLTDFSLKINSVGCAACRKEYTQALVSYAESHAAQLCDNCTRRLHTNPLRILDCKNPGCKEAYKNAPTLLKYLDPSCKKYLNDVVTLIRQTGGDKQTITIDPTLVRGLDYYTGVVFEYTSDRLGAQDALSAGGRYDTLVSELGGPDIPAVGFAMGLDRLVLVMPAPAPGQDQGKKIFIAVIGDEAKRHGFIIANNLRKRGIYTEVDLQDRSLKNQLGYASEKSFPHVVIIGDEELNKGLITLKNMRTNMQTQMKEDRLIPTLMK